jgi:cytochrome c6
LISVVVGKGRRKEEDLAMKSGLVRSALGVFLVLTTFLLFLPSARGDAAADYKAKCASCHAADGSGNSPTGKAMKVLDLGSPEVQKKTDEQLHNDIANGVGKMKGFKDKLKDPQITELVKFVRGLKK